MSALWNHVLGALEDYIPAEQIEEWLKPTKVLQSGKNGLNIVVPSDLYIDWINENYLDDIHMAIERLGHPRMDISFLTRDQAPAPAPVAAVPVPDEPLDAAEACRDVLKTNPKYTFGDFVVGSSNQFAHAAALAVAEAPSTSYNPLYLYGRSGLGKTHLLQAVAHHLAAQRPDLKICYTTCEEFTNQFINSIRFNRGEEFRERYRGVDVLLIDDIQFLGGKQQTQEEFFHTFNTLFEQQKQIILSSDTPPSEIPKLEARLTSRFQWGLIADIQPPALETRIAILKKKAEAEGTHVRDDVILYIAGKVKSNVRELEGALVKVLAYASLGRQVIDIALAERCLKSYIKEESSEINCEKIKTFVADRYHISSKDLCSRNNSKRIAQPRQIAMYLTREMTGMSLPEIGQAFGNKHHTTVLYSIQKVAKQMQDNAEYSTLIQSYQLALN